MENWHQHTGQNKNPLDPRSNNARQPPACLLDYPHVGATVETEACNVVPCRKSYNCPRVMQTWFGKSFQSLEICFTVSLRKSQAFKLICVCCPISRGIFRSCSIAFRYLQYQSDFYALCNLEQPGRCLPADLWECRGQEWGRSLERTEKPFFRSYRIANAHCLQPIWSSYGGSNRTADWRRLPQLMNQATRLGDRQAHSLSHKKKTGG